MMYIIVYYLTEIKKRKKWQDLVYKCADVKFL